MDLISAINNSALYANRAEKDELGRPITATYLTSSTIPEEYVTNEELSETLQAYPDLTAMSDFVFDVVDSATSSLPTSSDLDKKLDTSAFTEYTATADVTPYTTANNYITIENHTIGGYDWTDTITASATAASANAVSTVEGKFGLNSNNKISSYNGTAFAGEEYTAGSGIEITNNVISVSGDYVTSADASLNDKMLVLHNNAWMELPEMGGFATANSGAGGVPDVQNPSTKIIYLVKDSSVTGDDKYNEWIYTDNAGTTAWEKIGDTSINLSDYVAKSETANWDVSAYSGTNGISVANHEIGLSSDYVTAIQQVSGKLDETTFNTYTANADVTEYSAGSNIDITDHTISGKDWTTEIQTASANAVAEVSGKFATSSDGTNTYITAYDGTAFYSPDVSQFLTKASADTIYLTKTSADTLYQPIITFAGLTAED